MLGEKNYRPDYKITDPDERFKLLSECFKEFNHGIPNSILFTINTVGMYVIFKLYSLLICQISADV